MAINAYEKLARRFNKEPMPLKVLENDLLYEILRMLFSEEEALVVSNIPLINGTAGKVASKMHRPVEEIELILDRLADRGVIFSYGEGSDKKFFVLPIFPGVYELQMWKAPENENTRRLAKLYDEYYTREFSENMLKRQARVFRIIPIEKSLNPGEKTSIMPSDSIREVIDRHDAWSLANYCACRRQQEMLGKGCGNPMDVCMQFGPAARYIDKHGFGRLVSKEEILDAVDRAEEAGLIHFTDNLEFPYISCNCCACCCVSLATLTRFNTPAMFCNSRFTVLFDSDKCTACGKCAKACISGALHLYNKKIIFEPWRCIGCGACVPKCDQGALKLVPRKENIRVPASFGELFVSVGNEFMGTQKFVDKIMPGYTKAAGNFTQRLLQKMFVKK